MKELRKVTDNSGRCGACRYFYNEEVYGHGKCAVHPEIDAYREQECDFFEPKQYYGDDEVGRAE